MGSVLGIAAGVVAVGVMLLRLVDRRTALYGASVLATTPLWLAQPRPGVAVALAAIGIAVFDRALPRWARALAAATALALLVVVVRSLGRTSVVLAFDAPVAVLAKSFLPWTPLVAIAFVRRERRSDGPAARAIVFVMIASLAASVFFSPFLGAAPIACAIAVAARSLDDVESAAPAVVVTVGSIGFLVARDLDRATQSATWISVFLSSAALAVPKSWLPTSRGLVVIGSGAMAGLTLLLRHR